MLIKKLTIFLLTSIVIIAFFISCANERSIEQTINDFATAANTNDHDLLYDLLSEESDLWAGRPITVEELLVYLNAAQPISFSNLSINESGNDATVDATATYNIIPPFDVDFVMRKHDEKWKIKEYYDYVGTDPWAWKMLGRPEIIY
jgi:uncharacterized membrane protein YvbJ